MALNKIEALLKQVLKECLGKLYQKRLQTEQITT